MLNLKKKDETKISPIQKKSNRQKITKMTIVTAMAASMLLATLTLSVLPAVLPSASAEFGVGGGCGTGGCGGSLSFQEDSGYIGGEGRGLGSGEGGGGAGGGSGFGENQCGFGGGLSFNGGGGGGGSC
jgi:hypothetical protein